MRAALRERIEILLWLQRAESHPANVRCGIDGSRARWPCRFAVSWISGPGGDQPLGGRRARGACRAFRAAGDDDVADARLLPRNAVRGRGRREARDPDPRVRWRGPACQPRMFTGRDGLARGQGSASGELSWRMKWPRYPARWW